MNDESSPPPASPPENAAPYVVHHPGGASLFPRWLKHPYFIWSADFVRTSAGSKVLHLLCHTLNQLGARAYVVARKTSAELNTPILTRRIIDAYAEKGITPIVVYSETTPGNPMRASCVVRYLLNYVGHLGGDKDLNPEEFIVSYAKGIRADGGDEFVLHLPVANTAVFHAPRPDQQRIRSGSCVYVGKYRDVHGGKLFPVTDGMLEISRYRPDSQTQEQIAELFRTSEAFYCYENSTLALEAILSGCPVVLLPNPHFDRIIGSAEYQNFGVAWGDNAEQKAHARATVPDARARYDYLVHAYWDQLQLFIDKTQAMAASRTQVTSLEMAALVFPRGFGAPLAFAQVVKYLLFQAGWLAGLEVLRTILRSPAKWRAFKDEMKRVYGRVREDLLDAL